MSNKISHVRIAELKDKIAERDKIQDKIRTTQAEMQELKRKMSDKTDNQLRSSSNAAKLMRGMDPMSLTFEQEIDALNLSIARLEQIKVKCEEEIELLSGWG